MGFAGQDLGAAWVTGVNGTAASADGKDEKNPSAFRHRGFDVFKFNDVRQLSPSSLP